MTRRQFLLAGGTLAAATLLYGPFDAAADATDTQVDEYTLRVGYSAAELGPFRQRTRTYNASIPGPLMVTRPGHSLRVKLINDLPANPAATAPPGIDPINNPHAFNTTNLHMHGMQVIPHLFDPIGTVNPSASLIALDSGQSLNYEFQLPKDHPSGLYWYHPHFHGSAGVQVVNGMAGLILVKGPIDDVPQIAAARDELLAIQNLKLNPLSAHAGTWGFDPLAYQPPDRGGYAPTSKLELITANGRPMPDHRSALRQSGREPASPAHLQNASG